MRIVVFGASGGTGRHAVTLGQAQGHEMVAVARDPASLPDGFAIRERLPDLADHDALKRLLQGADAVVVTIGITRLSRSPLAALSSAKDPCTRAIAAILPAMAEAGVPRLVYVSAYGVGDTWREMPWWARAMIELSYVRWTYRDHAAAEALIARSALDWRILRPTLLTDGSGPPGRPMIPSDSPLLKVSREGLARYVLTNVADAASTRQRIAVVA
jgi:uncharacterized protein YbjT (DUF2867 family)